MARVTRTLQGRETAHSSDPHTVAVRFLEAVRTSRGYRYYAPETNKFYRVPVKEMVGLGVDLLDGTEDAYSLWCTRTHCKELSR